MPEAEKMTMFYNRLTKVYRHRSKQAKRQQISCYRVYDRDLPEFPLIIDLYGNKAYVAEYNAQHHLDETAYAQWLQQSVEVIRQVFSLDPAAVFLKQRKRKADRQDQYTKTGDEMVFYTVTEGGLQFRVNLSDYLDTGLFLDHRVTRAMVQRESPAKRVLNLFCYTASFSVYAAAGGAAAVVSVDLSKTYLQWAEENFRVNGLPVGDKFRFVQADVLQYLVTIPPQSFDLVILDPPTFSNSKRMQDFLDIQQDHVRLIGQCLDILVPGGILYFSTNYTRFELAREQLAATSIADISAATTPFDFTGKLRRSCFKIIK